MAKLGMLMHLTCTSDFGVEYIIIFRSYILISDHVSHASYMNIVVNNVEIKQAMQFPNYPIMRAVHLRIP